MLGYREYQEKASDTKNSPINKFMTELHGHRINHLPEEGDRVKREDQFSVMRSDSV